MLSKEEVKHIAKLSRINLSLKEIEKFQTELSKILDYIEKLKEIDIKDIKLINYPIELKNATRNDLEKLNEEKNSFSKKLLEMAPETKNNYLKVKTILKKD